MLANYEIKLTLCAHGQPLSDPLKKDHRISKYYLCKYYIRFALGYYLSKPYKWNKENVIITFRSYIRITLGNCVKLTSGSYVIKPSIWDQKIT